MREALAKALYESWCEGVTKGKGCFKPYAWEAFKVIPGSDRTPRMEDIYRMVDLVLRGFVGSVDIVFDNGQFVEVESPPGTSIRLGKWLTREDGYRVLRIPIQGNHTVLPEIPDDAIGCLVCWECRSVLFAEKGVSTWFPDGCETCGKWGLVIPVLKIPVPGGDSERVGWIYRKEDRPLHWIFTHKSEPPSWAVDVREVFSAESIE